MSFWDIALRKFFKHFEILQKSCEMFYIWRMKIQLSKWDITCCQWIFLIKQKREIYVKIQPLQYWLENVSYSQKDSIRKSLENSSEYWWHRMEAFLNTPPFSFVTVINEFHWCISKFINTFHEYLSLM